MVAISYGYSRRHGNISRWGDEAARHEEPLTFLDFKIADILLAAIVVIMPFCSLLDYFIFHGFTIAGLSVCNFTLSVTLVVCTLLNIATPNRRRVPFLLAGALLFVTMLAKLVLQPLGDLPTWLSGHEYYFLVPLFGFCCANVSDRHSPDLIGILLAGSLPVCALSLLFFLANDYLGMVPQEIMLAYDVVGMPFARMMGTFGSPNVAGAYFAVLLFFDLQRDPTLRGVALFRRGLLATCLLLSFSRMAIFGFLLAEMVFFLRKRKSHSGKVGINAARALIAIVGVLAIFVLFASLSGHGLYFFDLTNEDATNNLRYSKWLAFLQSGANAILLGEPIGSSYTYNGFTLSDNSFLCSIASFGFMVACSYWVLLLLGFKGNRKRQGIVPRLLMVLVFLLLSDFVQLFPSCYCAVLLLLTSGSNHCKEGMS